MTVYKVLALLLVVMVLATGGNAQAQDVDDLDAPGCAPLATSVWRAPDYCARGCELAEVHFAGNHVYWQASGPISVARVKVGTQVIAADPAAGGYSAPPGQLVRAVALCVPAPNAVTVASLTATSEGAAVALALLALGAAGVLVLAGLAVWRATHQQIK